MATAIPGWANIASTGLDALGGIMASRSAEKQLRSANESYLAASKVLAQLTPPSLVDALKPYKEAVFLGEITPEEYVAAVQQQSELNGIQTDPALIQQQYQTLAQMNKIATEGGLTAVDKAQLNDIADQEQMRARGARDAASQEAAARGISGSGLEMVRRDAADQAAVQSASKRGTDVAANAQARALQAMVNSGQLSGNIRDQGFREESTKATAQDAINRFNADMAFRAGSANTEAKNRAAEQALNKRYDNQDFNLKQDQLYADRIYNAKQQEWNNQADLAKAVSGRAVSQGNQQLTGAQNSATASANALTRVGNALPEAIQGVKNVYADFQNKKIVQPGSTYNVGTKYDTPEVQWADVDMSDRELKTDIQELSPEQITSVLDEITGFKYKYKNPKNGVGTQIGPMAQDIQKTAGSDMVVNTPEGLAIDKDKAVRFALAALAGVNSRIDKLEGK